MYLCQKIDHFDEIVWTVLIGFSAKLVSVKHNLYYPINYSISLILQQGAI